MRRVPRSSRLGTGAFLTGNREWRLLPVRVAACLLGLRTHWEDQTLQAELEGYREYTHRVPYKLILHVW